MTTKLPNTNPCLPADQPLALKLTEGFGPHATERADFERHAAGLGYSVDHDTRPGRVGGYWSSHTHLMWETWLAARAAERRRFLAALQEADTIMGHDDAFTEWREKWAHLWALR